MMKLLQTPLNKTPTTRQKEGTKGNCNNCFRFWAIVEIIKWWRKAISLPLSFLSDNTSFDYP
jgi:hypothetical protein